MSHARSSLSMTRTSLALAAWAVFAPACGGSDDPDDADTSIPIDDVHEDGSDTDAPDAPDATDADAAPDVPLDTVDAPEDDGSGEVIDDIIDDTDTEDADVVVPPPEELLPVDMVLEPSGDSALLTTMDGFVVRVDLTTMQVIEVLASGLLGPVGLALEADGSSVLLVERDVGRLVRLELGSGNIATIADGLEYPQGVAIVPGGASVLVTEGNGLSRIALADGMREMVSAVVVYGKDVLVEEGGETALVLESGQLTRVDLDTGGTSPVVTEQVVGEGTFRGALALSGDGSAALVNTEIGCLVLINIETTASQRVGCLYENDQMALAFEPGDAWAVLGTDSQLMRVNLQPELARVLEANIGIQWVAVEAGGESALLISEAIGVETPRLHRLDLDGGTLQTVATLNGFLGASGLVLEGGGASVLTLGQGDVDDGGVTALLRVDLATGAATEITRALDQCSGSDVAIAEGGAAALIACSPRLYRVDLGTGAVTVAATGLDYGSVAVADDGSWAVFSTMSGRELWRMDLPAGVPERIGRNLFGSNPPSTACTDVAIEEGGRSVLVTQSGLYGGPYAMTGRVVRVDLATGAVTVLVPGQLDAPGTFSCGTVGIAVEAGGGSALVAEYHQGVARVGLPVR